MKKIILLLCVFCVCACGNSYIERKEPESIRFEERVYNYGNIRVIKDIETGSEYLVYRVDHAVAITKLED